MKAVAITIHNNSSKDTAPQTVVSEAGKPTMIQATDNAHYELLDIEYDVAPDHIITRRDGDNLVVTFGQNNDGVVIIEGFYTFSDNCIVGVSETGEYYYYIPDTGEISDYLALLQVGDNLSGHALGGLTVEEPWWANSGNVTTPNQPNSEVVIQTTEAAAEQTAIPEESRDAEPMTSVDSSGIYTPVTYETTPINYAPWIFLGFVGVAGFAYAVNSDKDNNHIDDSATVVTQLATPTISLNGLTEDNQLSANELAMDTITITGMVTNISSNATSTQIIVHVDNNEYSTSIDGNNFSADIPTSVLSQTDSISVTVTVSDDDGNSQTAQSSLTYAMDNSITLEADVTDYSLSAIDTIVSGNMLDNSIVGNDLDNTLNGGQGNDTLTGGSGADTFVFSDLLDGSIDHITDFNLGEKDKIQLDSNIFSNLNTDMNNIMDYLNYDTNTGYLSYDSDAEGSLATAHFATLDTGLELVSDSFVVI